MKEYVKRFTNGRLTTVSPYVKQFFLPSVATKQELYKCGAVENKIDIINQPQ